jgi:hypothetical protein
MTRRSARALTAGLLLLAGVGTAAVPALGAEIRTETDLGGFAVATNAAPFKVLLDDPEMPLPRPPESAIVEADVSYTSADLGTGPASRATASSLWPGNLLGEGLPTATNGQVGQYPLKAAARYPDKPYETDATFDLQGQRIATDGGALMRASALGLDVAATAKFNPADVPGVVDIGAITSNSTATVTPATVAVGRSTSRATDVTLAGVIKIGSVSTVVETTSNGKGATSTGSTVVSNLTIAGVGVVVDEKGARIAGTPADSGPLPSGTFDPLKQAGISIDAIIQRGTKDTESATRDAGGLRITLDSIMFRQALNTNTPGPVTSALYDVFNQVVIPIPGVPDMRGNLYYLLAASPKITFILGAGQSATTANLPMGFEFPDTPPLPGPGGLGGTPGLGGASGGSGGSVGGSPILPGTDVPAPTLPEGNPPTVGGGDPQLAGSSMPAGKAVSFLLLLGALIAASIGGWLLTRLQAFAFGGGLLAGCALGAPSSVPDLHQGA